MAIQASSSGLKGVPGVWEELTCNTRSIILSRRWIRLSGARLAKTVSVSDFVQFRRPMGTALARDDL